MAALPFPILPAEDVLVSDFDPLEPGWYTAEVTAEKDKTSAAGNEMNELEFTLASRKVWKTYNILHPDTKVRDIAQREISQLAAAAGLVAVADTKELIGSYVQICLKVVPANIEKGFKARNDVTAYRSSDNSPAAPGVVAAVPNSAPWAKAG